ncbi:hypothetical protein EDM22_17255 [Agromyces tardus]|uniref:Uncharacterized protein n=1 Tax=Agromyces tardus TaxID=2583849 RepID=A0A3M8A396_9MICO|nr:hypothetical protein EDM22_17255 [Agromyces tardus]
MAPTPIPALLEAGWGHAGRWVGCGCDEGVIELTGRAYRASGCRGEADAGRRRSPRVMPAGRT